MQSATITTVAANELMAEIHNTKKRMPLILDPADFDLWLKGSPEGADKLVRAYPSVRMEAWPVSTLVNNAGNDDPRCMERRAA